MPRCGGATAARTQPRFGWSSTSYPKAACRDRRLLAGTASWVRLQIAAVHGGRADRSPARPPPTTSDLRLLRDLEGVVDLDAEVSHCRLELRMSKEQLNGTQILGTPVDQRCLGPSHRVRPVLGTV